jgi:hypothetical protein
VTNLRAVIDVQGNTPVGKKTPVINLLAEVSDSVFTDEVYEGKCNPEKEDQEDDIEWKNPEGATGIEGLKVIVGRLCGNKNRGNQKAGENEKYIDTGASVAQDAIPCPKGHRTLYWSVEVDHHDGENSDSAYTIQLGNVLQNLFRSLHEILGVTIV